MAHLVLVQIFFFLICLSMGRLLLINVGRMREREKGHVAHSEGNKSMSGMPWLKQTQVQNRKNNVCVMYTVVQVCSIVK